MLRRNHRGDKDKALTIMEELLKQQENQVPDFLCLCGRIYKDKFVESDYSDNESRDKAIYWWVSLTGLPIGYSVIVALTGLPIGYSVIVALLCDALFPL